MSLTYISIAIGGEGLAAGILWATVSDVAPKGAEGKLAGLQNFVGNLAGWIAPVVTGVLVAKFNNFNIALIIPVVICLIAAVGYTFVLKNERISINTDIDGGTKVSGL
jgi:MFS family permease